MDLSNAHAIELLMDNMKKGVIYVDINMMSLSSGIGRRMMARPKLKKLKIMIPKSHSKKKDAKSECPIQHHAAGEFLFHSFKHPMGTT